MALPFTYNGKPVIALYRYVPYDAALGILLIEYQDEQPEAVFAGLCLGVHAFHTAFKAATKISNNTTIHHRYPRADIQALRDSPVDEHNSALQG